MRAAAGELRAGDAFEVGPMRLRMGALAALAMALVIAAFSVSTNALSIDDAIYAEMARAFAMHGDLAIAGNGGVDGAPPLTRLLTLPVEGRVYAQYPAGYGIIAAPFYAAFGVSGLILLNALGALVVVATTWRLAFRLYGERSVADGATFLLVTATFLPAYAVAIWPHVLTLAFVMAGVDALTAAVDPSTAARGWRRRSLAFAGCLLTAVAVLIRVDAILLLGALYFWLRLFAAPSDRSVALWAIAGSAAPLLVAAILNDLKFGEFTPVSYGPKGGRVTLSAYSFFMIPAAAAAILAWRIDVTAPRAARAIRALMRPSALLVAAGVALAGVAATSPGRDFLGGLYVLAIDIQALDPRYLQEGVTRLESGLLSFWGLSKGALLQTCPFAVLALYPLFDLLTKGRRRVSAHALCLAMIATPLAFYALRQWHGGYGLSMRYLTPALPFVSILCAWTAAQLLPRGAAGPVLAGAAAGALAMLAAPPPTVVSAAGLYLPLAAAGLLTLAAGGCIIRRESDLAGSAFAAALGFAVGISIAVTAQSVSIYQHLKAIRTPYEQAHLSAFPPGSLVLTQADDLFLAAGAVGVHIMRAPHAVGPAAESAVRAASAFVSAGRCVYLHTDGAKSLAALMPAIDFQSAPISGLSGAGAAVLYAPDRVCAPRIP